MNKPLMLLTTFLFLSISTAISQPYGINLKVDEFTGDTIITSDWVTLNDPVWEGFLSYVRLVDVDDAVALQFKLTTMEVTSVDTDDLLYIKLEDGNMITLNVGKQQLTEKGAGAIKHRASAAFGFNLFFSLSDSELDQLKTTLIDKVRLTSNAGNFDIEPRKDKYRKEMRDYFDTFLEVTSKL